MRTGPFILAACLLLPTVSQAQEDAYNTSFCTSMGGEKEARHDYTYPTGTSSVRVDCETADTVYKGGLDRRSSLDSVQQALFFAHLTGKKPAVVITTQTEKSGGMSTRLKLPVNGPGWRSIVFPSAGSEQFFRPVFSQTE